MSDDHTCPMNANVPLQEIKVAYERDHGMSLMRAVNKGCGGTYRRCLLGCLFPSSEVLYCIVLYCTGEYY